MKQIIIEDQEGVGYKKQQTTTDLKVAGNDDISKKYFIWQRGKAKV